MTNRRKISHESGLLPRWFNACLLILNTLRHLVRK